MCLPAIQRIRPEYAELFPLGTPETETKAGKAALLGAFSAQLQEWAPMLQRFLKDHDDQASAATRSSFLPPPSNGMGTRLVLEVDVVLADTGLLAMLV